jgi:hypothetical protein
MFERYCHSFSADALNATVNAYPTPDKAKLKTELSLIYENPEFKACCGALALYQVIMSYNLQETFSETTRGATIGPTHFRSGPAHFDPGL